MEVKRWVLFSVCVCVPIHVCTYVCECMSICTCKSLRLMLDVFFKHPSSHSLRQGLSIEPRLNDKVSLNSQLAPESRCHQYQEYWNFRGAATPTQHLCRDPHSVP